MNNTSNDGKKSDEFQIGCRIKAMAALLGNIHKKDSAFSSAEAFGIELLLDDIAEMIDPTTGGKS